MKTLYAIGRAIEKLLNGVGAVIVFCVVLAAIILAVPLIEYAIYAGVALWLVCAVPLVAAFLAYEGWKRLRAPRG
jgi:hypothetical protein